MDENWVKQLAYKYRSELLCYLKHHTDSAEDAEDLCQEIFLNCYRYRESFDPERCEERVWLYVIAGNRLKNYYRDKKPSASLDEMEYEITNGMDETSKAVFLMEIRDEIAQALKKLDERSRSVIILRFFEEKSHREIAEILGMKEGSVRMAQKRALQKIKRLLFYKEGATNEVK